VGSDKDQIAVTGEGIDSVELTTLLRKGVGYTELVSVGPVEEKKPEAKESKATVEVNPYQYYYNYYGTPYYVYEMWEIETKSNKSDSDFPIVFFNWGILSRAFSSRDGFWEDGISNI